ncbi:MAG: ABC-type Fe3+-hydroxamate transport system substrate-binding protein [Gammaproteobacteria bacterium]|jgi:ABC-type Fe3+-hydroxamate transport system substrate-binding protein
MPGVMSEAKMRVDASGVAHAKAGPEPRIVSLVPSLTELLCELGLVGSIVARTGFCIHPRDQVRAIPKVGGTKDVNIGKIRQLAPTHVIVNIDENTKETAAELAGFVENIIVTHPIAPRDNLLLFELMGFLFSAEERAGQLIERFSEQLELLSFETDKEARDVLYLIWRDPWMTVTSDTYISRMLDLISWRTLPEQSPDRYPAITLSDYVGKVGTVLLSSEPYPFKSKHIAEVKEIFGSDTKVSLVDGEMLSWYGSRAIAGLDYLRNMASRQH